MRRRLRTPREGAGIPEDSDPVSGRRVGSAVNDDAPHAMYARVGGREFFVGLVNRFYEGVASDPILRPMYEEDLDQARLRLVSFLSQYFGGTREYEELRGSPMLRARHLKFPIDEVAKDAWLVHMGNALDRSEISPDDREEMWRYFVAGANFFVNRGGLGLSGS